MHGMRPLLPVMIVLVLGCRDKSRREMIEEQKQTYDDLGARAAASARAAMSRSQKETEERRERERADETERAAKEAAKGVVEQQVRERAATERRQQYVGMTPQQREKSLRDACARPDGCERELREAIATAGANDAERSKLKLLADKLGVATDVAARQWYVGEVARSFIAQGRKDFSVDAPAAATTRFIIKAPFCSQAFLRSFVDGPLGAGLRPKGFTVARCESAGESWSIAL